MASPVKVRSALACDDIRTEESGKLIAVGITNPVIGLEPEDHSPRAGAIGILRVHFLLSIDVAAAGEHEISFRVRGLSGKRGSRMRAKVDFTASEKNIPFPIGPLRVPIQSGERGFAFEQWLGDRWKRVATWKFDSPVPVFGPEAG